MWVGWPMSFWLPKTNWLLHIRILVFSLQSPLKEKKCYQREIDFPERMLELFIQLLYLWFFVDFSTLFPQIWLWIGEHVYFLKLCAYLTVLKLARETGKQFSPIFFEVCLCCKTFPKALTTSRHTDHWEGLSYAKIMRGLPEKIKMFVGS